MSAVGGTLTTMDVATDTGLSVRGHMVLAHAELAGDWYRRGGLIRENLGCSQWQYAAELDALIDTQAAEAEYPALVHRLRRLRDERRAHRSSRRIA